MKPHKEWIFKAKQDIESSGILFQSSNPLFDIAIYHTQQCAEKSLKAFLAFNMKEINKTHNLKTLLESCSLIDDSFEELFDDCIFLDPFATLYRYPEGDLMPEKQEVVDALVAAERILDFVIKKMN